MSGATEATGKKKKKVRVDSLVADLGLAESRTRAQALVMAGRVFVGGERVDKPGTPVDPDSDVTVTEGLKYVGRGGVKLEGSLDAFGVDVSGLVAADVGSSTGGFTDCMLQRGALRVYAIDVGRGLIDVRLRNDNRVVLMEGRNVRSMTRDDLPEAVDLAVVDLSFISLEKVLGAVRSFCRPGAVILALVKPQFEVGKGEVGKGGVVRDPKKHAAVIERIKGFAESMGMEVLGVCDSPITGAKGNREFWMHLVA